MLLNKFHFPAAAFLGWIRLARPGSVLGPQQHFLINVEEELLYGESSKSKYRQTLSYGRENSNNKCLEMSPYDRITGKYGDDLQANRLLTAKKLRDGAKFV